MRSLALHIAGALFLALALIPAPATAQPETLESDDASTLDSLVLVLNLISSTHARPSTGVVLASGSQSGNALVLVAADFVAAGDEIIVLDGGNDILKNGRSTRTVARSSAAGVAVLEVEGLLRPGVALSSDPWPSPAAAAFEFAAWPAAEALAEGASLTTQMIRLQSGQGGSEPSSDPPLPQVSGPIFNHCGNLAAVHLPANEGRLVGTETLSRFMKSFDLDLIEASCFIQSEVEEGSVFEVTTDISPSVETDRNSEQASEIQSQTLHLSRSQIWGVTMTWIFLGLLAMVLYVRRQKRKEGVYIVLEGQDSHGRRAQRKLRLGRESQQTSLEQGGGSVTFRLSDLGVVVSILESDPDDPVGLAIAGTPCLDGESFVINEGQQIQLGGESYSVRLESDENKLKRVKT